MTNSPLLCFAIKTGEVGGAGRRVLDAAVLEIHTDSAGMGELIGRLENLKTANESPARLHWRTPTFGGKELTEETWQGVGALIHDVRVFLWRDIEPGPDQMLLTVELACDGNRVQVHCDPAGLDRLISMLVRLSKTKHRIDHDHWMTERWAGHELTGHPKGEGTVLINMVNVYFER